MAKSAMYNIQSAGSFQVKGISYHGPVNNIALEDLEVNVLKTIGFLVVPVNKPKAKSTDKPADKVDDKDVDKGGKTDEEDKGKTADKGKGKPTDKDKTK